MIIFSLFATPVTSRLVAYRFLYLSLQRALYVVLLMGLITKAFLVERSQDKNLVDFWCQLSTKFRHFICLSTEIQADVCIVELPAPSKRCLTGLFLRVAFVK